MAAEGKDVTNPDARRQGLHRHVLHHRAGQEALSAARPAVRQPLLVPLRLVHRPDYKAKFKAKYGYDLGVPVNWSAYEDIAEFFTNDIKEINGVKVYGHMDYGKKDPSLGWRFTDAWLSMAGNGDKGLPNGLPVDEWGIRMEGCRPVGSSVERGGDTNGPAAVYSIAEIPRLAEEVCPAAGARHDLLRVRPGAGAGQYRPADVLVHRLHRRHGEAGPAVMNADGTPKWRMAPSPHGSYWKEGMKLGYQDVGSGRCSSRRRRSPQGGLALSAVHHLEDGVAEEEPCRPHLHP
jgi:hypothetical protein